MENNAKNAVPIAVVGMECFFPKSSGLKEYWRLIFRGEDAITDIPDTHWSAEDYFDEDPKKPDHVYCKRGGFLDPVSFDPTEFGIPPAILEATDTSQLLALMAAKAALENAGYDGKTKAFDKENTSVILGVTGTQELVIPLSSRLGHPIWRKALKDSGVDEHTIEDVVERIGASYVPWQESSFPGLLGNVVAGRICNRLDLGGTNCVLDAACASSLGAISMAMLELTSGRSNMVVTGGVDALNDIFMHMCFSKTSVLSPTGDARPFSKDADGTVLGEGVGIVLLKRLEDAEKDQDRIYAVIKGMGSSSDGKSQSIYAPRPEGQIKALEKAYLQAGIDPWTIELIEAHGTGTSVGDEVEFSALNRFFKDAEDKKGNGSKPRVLGSVKSNIGHTKAAAGVAGLIKTVLALHNKVLPPTLKIQEPDPNLDIANSSFYFTDQSRPWMSSAGHPRRAGVSAFGFGGSNFHAVLEEYRKGKQETGWNGAVEILPFSNESIDDLKATLQKTNATLNDANTFKHISQTASELRAVFDHTKAFRLLIVIDRDEFEKEGANAVVSKLEDAVSNLAKSPVTPEFENKTTFFGGPETPGKIAFVFPGQGAQYVGMGSELVCTFPQAFDVLEMANALFSDKQRLTDFIYPVPTADRNAKKEQEADLTNTDIAQPAIGSISLAMLKIIQHFGLKPDATCGHSFGELVALNSAGWMADDALLTLAVNRGRLMAAAGKADGDPGTMLAVKAPLEELDKLIADSDTGVILANRNSPTQGVLSGPKEAIEKANALCKEKGFKTVALSVAAAFHSHLMQDAQKPFMEIVQKTGITPTQIPVYSNSSGTPYPTEPGAAKKILGEQLLRHVDFVNDVKNLYASGVKTFVEVGPRTVLTGLIKAILREEQFNIIPVDASGGRKSNMLDLALALAELAALGYPVVLKNWESGGTPPSDPRKPKMEVKISGSNYRSSQSRNNGKNSKNKTNIARKADAPKPDNKINNTPVKGQRLNPMKNNSNTAGAKPAEAPIKSETMKLPIQTALNSPATGTNDLMKHALAVVQEGLKSMQALQKQTSETHQKFLESQAQANQTLEKMMENTQRMIFGGTPGTQPVDMGTHQSNAARLNLTGDQNETAVRTAPENTPEDTIDTSFEPEEKRISRAPNTNQDDAIIAVLLETVSELTGYPEDMLGLDMDIESDLGIDSIKRVEILSTMEEKLPGLPPVEPEIMGALKTLNQIIQHLSPKSQKDEGIAPPKILATKGILPTTGNTVTAILLETVSELTGYPEDMLGLDMDIESDLGIDSIKRVEILSTMEEKLPGLPPVEPEIMGALKTLNQIIQYLSPARKKTTPKDAVITSDVIIKSKNNTYQTDAPKAAVTNQRVKRQIISLVSTPLAKITMLCVSRGKRIYVIDNQTPVCQAIVDDLMSRKIDSELISFEVTPSDEMLSNAAGLVIPALPQDSILNATQQMTFLKNALMAAKHFAPALENAAKQGLALFAGISFMDGGFGFKNQKFDLPMMGALAGLIKTAATEWKGVLCRALDVSPSWSNPKDMASVIVDELLYAAQTAPVEVGLCPDNRYTLKLEPSQCPSGNLTLSPQDIVVVSGGARGVTAATAHALAKEIPLKFILLGRSPQPFEEPLWLNPFSEEREMKKAILTHEFKGQKISPKDVEEKYKAYQANREVRQNIMVIKSLGSDVIYHSVDIRDTEKVASLFKDIQKIHGEVSAVIHGAGVLDDKLIVDKTPDQFKTVFETKVKGLLNIIDAVKKEPLKYLVFFSSVAGRMGNKGQSDYAMANEALNKIAQKEAISLTNCRVISINWGPWDGGMVSSALKKEFEKNNIGLISVDQGAQSLVNEMKAGTNQSVEVILGSMIETTSPHKGDLVQFSKSVQYQPCPKINNKLSMAFQRDIDTDEYPVLNSHVLGGTPVVPFALMAEWFSHGALHGNPGLVLQGLDDMRMLKGIQINGNKRKIRILTGKVRKTNFAFEVDVEIRNGIPDEQEVLHSKAKAILTDALAHPPEFKAPGFMGSNGYSRTIDEIYKKILFHGYALQGMKEVTSLTDDGMIAKILPAPAPGKWMKNPLRNNWVGDPLVLDSAFQMASLWCFEKLGNVSLPVYSATYRQYRHQFPKEPITAVLELRDATNHKMTGDFTFLDSQNTIIAQITGYEAVVDESLNKAFKP